MGALVARGVNRIVFSLDADGMVSGEIVVVGLLSAGLQWWTEGVWQEVRNGSGSLHCEIVACRNLQFFLLVLCFIWNSEAMYLIGGFYGRV